MLHRRDFCKGLAAAPATLATPALMRSAFADEVSSIVLISQTGLPYLPMMVMEHFKLIEKHAEKLGVASISDCVPPKLLKSGLSDAKPSLPACFSISLRCSITIIGR